MNREESYTAVYEKFLVDHAQFCRSNYTNAQSHLDRYKWMEEMEQILPYEKDLQKLQAAVNLNQKPTIKRLQNKLDLFREMTRMRFASE